MRGSAFAGPTLGAGAATRATVFLSLCLGPVASLGGGASRRGQVLECYQLTANMMASSVGAPAICVGTKSRESRPVSDFIITAAYAILFSSLVVSATLLLIAVLIALRSEKVGQDRIGRRAIKPERPGWRSRALCAWPRYRTWLKQARPPPVKTVSRPHERRQTIPLINGCDVRSLISRTKRSCAVTA